jgi:hypothetical protein
VRNKEIKIKSREYCVKIVECLQQNWALVDENADGTATVYFIHDMSGVFDQMDFDNLSEATLSLHRNYFVLYDNEDPIAQQLMPKPEPPFFPANHPNGLIYSSGRFWI